MNAESHALDDRLVAFYAAQALERHEVAAIVSAVRALSQEHEAPRAIASRRRVLLLLTAAAVLLVGAALMWQAMRSGERASAWDGRAVADEIAKDHARGLPAEVVADSIAGLASQMPRLGFMPVEPSVIRNEHLTVLGARYCSIGSRPACFILLRDDRGRSCTMYEFRAETALRDGSGETHAVGEVTVRLWREGDLVFGLACPR